MDFGTYDIFDTLDCWPLRISHQDYAPTICGVYIFVVYDQIVYIGSSKNIKERLKKTHPIYRKIPRNHSIYVIPCYNYLTIEISLIRFFLPISNRLKYNKSVLLDAFIIKIK